MDGLEPGVAQRHHAVGGFASIGAGTLVSRISGFVREVVVAAFFGAGTAMDIFVAAYTIPNLLCRVLGESAVESGFMPLFKGMHSRGDRPRAWLLAGRTLSGLALVLSVVVVFGIAASPFLVGVVAHGFRGEVAEAAVHMTRLMFPFGLAIGLAALLGAILLAFERYRVYSLAPVLLNVGIIASVLTLSGRIGYVSLGVGVLLGGVLQFLVQVPFVNALARQDGQRVFGAGLGWGDPDVRRVGRLTMPVVAAAAIQRVGVVVDRTIASFLVPGSISSLYYSFRLVHLPYAILALAAGRSVAPVLAEQFALGRHREFSRTVAAGTRMIFAYLAPVTVLAVMLARPIVGLVYQRGAFDRTDLAMTASAFALYSVGLVAMGVVFLLVRAFAARLDTKTPVKVSIAAFFLNVGLNLALVRTPLRHAGLALASSLAFAAHAVVLYSLLNRRMEAAGAPVRWSDLTAPTAMILAACAVEAAVVWVVQRLLGMRFAGVPLLNWTLTVALAGGAGGTAYLYVASRLRLSEVTDLLARVGRRRA